MRLIKFVVIRLKKVGGISVYIFVHMSDRLVAQQITLMDLKKHEFSWVEIFKVGIPLNVVTVYSSVGDNQLNVGAKGISGFFILCSSLF